MILKLYTLVGFLINNLPCNIFFSQVSKGVFPNMAARPVFKHHICFWRGRNSQVGCGIVMMMIWERLKMCAGMGTLPSLFCFFAFFLSCMFVNMCSFHVLIFRASSLSYGLFQFFASPSLYVQCIIGQCLPWSLGFKTIILRY